jgi:hypothetical protein
MNTLPWLLLILFLFKMRGFMFFTQDGRVSFQTGAGARDLAKQRTIHSSNQDDST